MSRLNSRIQSGQFGSVNNAGRRRQRPQPVVLVKGPAQGREHTDDRGLDSLQQKANDAFQQGASGPFANAALIQNLSFVSGTPLTIPHGLRRAFVSAMLCGQSAPGTYSVQRAAAVVRPPSNQNRLDMVQVIITANFTGIADCVVW